MEKRILGSFELIIVSGGKNHWLYENSRARLHFPTFPCSSAWSCDQVLANGLWESVMCIPARFGTQTSPASSFLRCTLSNCLRQRWLSGWPWKPRAEDPPSTICLNDYVEESILCQELLGEHRKKTSIMFPFFIFRFAAAASVTQNDVDHHPWSLYYLKLSICGLNLAVSTVENLVGRVGGLCEALNGRKAHRLRSSGPIPACICCAGCGLSPEGSLGLEENVLTVVFSLGCFINIACSAAGFLMRFLSARACHLSVLISSFFSWRAVHCSDFISSIWFQNLFKWGEVLPILRAAEFEDKQNHSFTRSRVLVEGAGKNLVSVKRFLKNTNLVLKNTHISCQCF